MKKIIIFLSIIFALGSCHKTKVDPPDTIHSLIDGLPNDTKLPNQDTTGAFSYIIGSIGDLPFSIIANKDSATFIDYASLLFFPRFDTIWKIQGGSGYWELQDTKNDTKKWAFRFWLPSFLRTCTEASTKQYRIDQTTPQTFTNVGSSALSSDPTKGNQFSFELHRTDSYTNPIFYPIEDHSIGTSYVDQKDSYVKLVSVKRYDYVANTNFHYEVIYEFSFNVGPGYSSNYARMKGKARFWLQTIGR